ncbi:MarR family winged helix-turn-helix transcriptional regulator [Roseateles asaccharophilus]|uniref:DNA-binding MarR family transcriptional regulator n=1 Tax=Roseateles asaccharophilus TaxID=582607 RepID=A0ABU2AFW9_9BURK|nr:MarR family winged helix-turn-helix transcriptional regulator [Roseateles asaccharophilus]MDR7336121.1 DNA-binding MarR family transcriptional regulator [Roseateles asaccharophilus]
MIGVRQPPRDPEMPGTKPKQRKPLTSEDNDLDEAALVLRQFRQILNTVRVHFQQVEKKAGIGGGQVWALSVVGERPGIGVSELARAMDVHQSTASNLVKTLVEKAFIETRREGADRRAVQLHLRPQGLKVLRRAPGPFAGVLPQALRTLDGPSVRRLRKDLAKLIAILHADEKAGQIPLSEM